jgi:hypothetical protein
MKRPLTIWVTQCVLIVFALLFLSVFLMNLVRWLTHLEQEVSAIPTVAGYSIVLGFIILLIVAFWGLAKRATYGRWLAVLSLLLIWGLLILTQLRRPSGPAQYYQYDNNAQLAGAIMGGALLHGLMLLLILRLSVSRQISKFFAKQVEAGDLSGVRQAASNAR